MNDHSLNTYYCKLIRIKCWGEFGPCSWPVPVVPSGSRGRNIVGMACRDCLGPVAVRGWGRVVSSGVSFFSAVVELHVRLLFSRVRLVGSPRHNSLQW